MRFVHVPLLNLANRPLRAALTALGIAVAVGSFVALVGASRGFERACVGGLSERAAHLVAVRKGTVDFLSASMDESTGDELRRVEGVAAVAGELLDVAVLEPDETILATGWRRNDYLWHSVRLRVGAMPGPQEPNGVVLGEATADGLGKTVGDTISLREREFRVTGISGYAGAMNRTVLVMPLTTMQAVMERPGKVTFFSIRVSHPEDREGLARLKARLAQRFPHLKFCDARELVEDDQFLKLFRATTWSISLIALFMGLVVILNTLLMSVTERTYDIGVLSAVGWQPGRILAMILLEGLLLAIAGTVLGSLFGIGLLEFLAELPQVRGFLEPQVSVRLLGETCVAALLMGVAGSVYPAWRAVRLNPVDALRYE